MIYHTFIATSGIGSSYFFEVDDDCQPYQGGYINLKVTLKPKGKKSFTVMVSPGGYYQAFPVNFNGIIGTSHLCAKDKQPIHCWAQGERTAEGNQLTGFILGEPGAVVLFAERATDFRRWVTFMGNGWVMSQVPTLGQQDSILDYLY